MNNTKKLLYSLYAAGIVLGASALSGCSTTRTVYVYPDGTRMYAPTPSSGYNNTSCGGEILSSILMGIGQGLSGL